MVRALAGRTGVCGDHRGRLVWAEIQWGGEGTAEPEFPDGYESSLRDIQGVLTARYPEADIWFGRTTMQWWAMIGRPEKGHPEARRLLTAESPVDRAFPLRLFGGPVSSAGLSPSPGAARPQEQSRAAWSHRPAVRPPAGPACGPARRAAGLGGSKGRLHGAAADPAGGTGRVGPVRGPLIPARMRGDIR